LEIWLRSVALCADEREDISRGLAEGLSGRLIATLLGRDASVVSREIVRNGGRESYRAYAAQERADVLVARPKTFKLEANAVLHDAVAAGLVLDWSPQQISARLVVDHPDDLELRVSHETIYQALYLQARGELRTELKLALRKGRTVRVPRGSTRPKQARIAGMVNISRFVILARIPHDRTAERVAAILARAMSRLPEALQRSLTWDQGVELAAHAKFTVATDIPVYFCDPHSPWQRGSNENTNGLLRQYFPKGTDLSPYYQLDLDEIADKLNGRPRETLGWKTPAEKLEELLRSSGDALTT
jgi:IS30 family transposase